MCDFLNGKLADFIGSVVGEANTCEASTDDFLVLAQAVAHLYAARPVMIIYILSFNLSLLLLATCQDITLDSLCQVKTKCAFKGTK